MLCFQGQRPGVYLAQPIGLGTPVRLKTVRANGPAICQFSLAISKRPGRWPYNLPPFRFPGRWPGLGKLLGLWPDGTLRLWGLNLRKRESSQQQIFNTPALAG